MNSRCRTREKDPSPLRAQLVAASRMGGISILFGISSFIEAWVLVAIVGLVNDDARLPDPANSPIVLIIATTARYLVGRLGTKLLNWDSSNYRSSLALQTAQHYSSSTWIERQALAPSELRAVSLYLPHDLSNTRHAMFMAIANSTSALLLMMVAFIASPPAVLGLSVLAPLLIASSVPRARRASRHAAEANRHRLSHAQLNEVLVYGFDELRPAARRHTFDIEYEDAVTNEARATRRLRDLDGLGPLQLTTIVLIGVVVLLSLTNANPDGSDVAAYLILLRVALLLQSVSQLPTAVAEFRSLRCRFNDLAMKLPQVDPSRRHTGPAGETPRRPPPTTTEVGSHVFDARNLSFQYPHGPRIGPITFSIRPNALTCIIGPSGSGKTTLARLLVNDLQPTSGHLHLASHISPDDIRFVPQFPRLREDTVEKNVAFWLNEPSAKDLHNAVDAVGLSHLTNRGAVSASEIDHVEDTKNQQMARLSGGETLRVGLARAMVGMNAGILILDEPTSALDEETAIGIVELLLKMAESMTVIVVSHDKRLINQAHETIEVGSIIEEEIPE